MHHCRKGRQQSTLHTDMAPDTSDARASCRSMPTQGQTGSCCCATGTWSPVALELQVGSIRMPRSLHLSSSNHVDAAVMRIPAGAQADCRLMRGDVSSSSAAFLFSGCSVVRDGSPVQKAARRHLPARENTAARDVLRYRQAWHEASTLHDRMLVPPKLRPRWRCLHFTSQDVGGGRGVAGGRVNCEENVTSGLRRGEHGRMSGRGSMLRARGLGKLCLWR